MDKKVQSLLDNVVRQISGETISTLMQNSLFGADIPMKKWSILNQFMCMLSGTQDARGYRQWQQVGRHVTKGARAIYILAPNMVRKKQKVEKEIVIDGILETEETEIEITKIYGFKSIPVFRYEDTDGEPIEYIKQIEKVDPEQLPLYDVAKELGITISVEATSKGEYGSFSPNRKKIRLCTDSEQVFLHELSHAIDDHLDKCKDYALGEVVAELSACFLASLFDLKANIGGTQKYIKSWSKGKHVALSIGNALERVKRIYKHIEAHQKRSQVA